MNRLIFTFDILQTSYIQASKTLLEAESNIAKAKEDEENLRHWIKELEQLSPRIGR